MNEDSDVLVVHGKVDLLRAMEDSVELGDGVRVPTHFTASTVIGGMTVQVGIHSRPGGTSAMSVSASTEDGRPVTSERLRQIPVTRIVQAATRQVIWTTDGDGLMELMGVHAEPFPDEIRELWPDGGPLGKHDLEVFLRWVAMRYRVASAVGDPPTVAVAQAAGVSRATAGRMVDAARREGFLAGAADGE